MVTLKPRVWRHRSTNVWLTRCEICSATVKSSSWAWAWKTALGHVADGGHLARAREELIREGVAARLTLRRQFEDALDSEVDLDSGEGPEHPVWAAQETAGETVQALAEFLEAVGERPPGMALPRALVLISNAANLLASSGLQEAA